MTFISGANTRQHKHSRLGRCLRQWYQHCSRPELLLAHTSLCEFHIHTHTHTHTHTHMHTHTHIHTDPYTHTHMSTVKYTNTSCSSNTSTWWVAWWPSGYGAGPAMNRSQVQIPAAVLPSATLSKLLHARASVTKQYNLVPANRQWCSAAGEVTTGLEESNGSLLSSLWLWSPPGWLPRTGMSSGTLYSFPVWH